MLGALCVSVALAGSTGCIGKRRPKAEDKAATAKSTPAVPTQVAPKPAPADGDAQAPAASERWKVAFTPADPAKGAGEPLVTIVEFSDFECPYCGKFATTLDELMPQYKDEVRVVFKHYPLPSHANAQPAAIASLAAAKQGKFWQLHDLLFKNQSALGASNLRGYAEAIGLDMAKFDADIADRATAAAVMEQYADGRVLEISTTPSYFVNGRLVTGALPADEIKAILDEEIADARKVLASGTARPALYAHYMAGAKDGNGTRPKQDPTHRRGDASKSTNYGISVGDASPIKGPADALVTIIEFNAFDCEACKTLQPALKAILTKYPKDVRLVWRNFPGDSNSALGAARAGLAAHEQEKFWEMHDKLFENSGDLNFRNVTAWAAELGLDAKKFADALRNKELATTIALDIAVAESLRGSAPAPFLWVNGRIVDSRDNPTVADIDALIVEEKAKAEAFMADKKVSRAELYEAMRATWRGAALVDKAAAAAP